MFYKSQGHAYPPCTVQLEVFSIAEMEKEEIKDKPRKAKTKET
jgi:hypothetical protein